MSFSRFLRNALGAFADGAVLFPLLAAMSVSGGFSGAILLASAGLAYLAAGLLFRVPMSVQPLKSIAIASVAIGASQLEVRMAALALALVLLALLAAPIDRWAEKVPASFVHGLQVALGILLIGQGAKYGLNAPVLGLSAAMVVFPKLTGVPVLGVLATAGLVWAVYFGERAPAISAAPGEVLRQDVLLGLVLPQIALTLGNSVLGTRDVARRYFGEKASRVTARRLLASIGIGNVLVSAVGGLPFCHGSGGVTAHVRGGADHWSANLIIGLTLLTLSAAQLAGGFAPLRFPAPLLASLLIATGIFHVGLAVPTFRTASGASKIAMAALIALATRNMLYVFLFGAAMEFGALLLRRKVIA